MKRFELMFCALCACVLLAGCSGNKPIKTDYVEGTITYKGQPVAEATVSFSPVSGGSPAYGRTDAQGLYKLQTQLGAVDEGTTPGEYVVMVSKKEAVPTGRTETDSDGNVIPITVSKSLLPEIYSSASKSPLKATVVAGKNTFDFELLDK